MKNTKNKNKIKLIESDQEITDIFLRDNETDCRENVLLVKKKSEFETLLDESLAGVSDKDVMKQKFNTLSVKKEKTLKQKIKHYPDAQNELDLHGYNANEAVQKTNRFILNSYHKGLKTIRIIVGKGLHSKEGPVLPDIIEKKLPEFIKKNLVLTYEWDKKIKKKSGSILIYLNY